MKLSKFLLAGLFAILTLNEVRATIGVDLQMQLGNPSNATADATNHEHYLIQRAHYALDYNDNNGEPNWVSWDLTTDDIGGSGRSNNFIPDPNLPQTFYALVTGDYTGSGYDRGHMCPSADRTITIADNQVTFILSNILPQAPDNNQGVWANFEGYCRSLASAGNEVLITSGGSGYGGSRILSGKAAIPGYTWKIVVVVPLGAGSAVSRITASTRVIAIKVPNIAGVRSTPWQNFVTSIAQIEADTGFTFLTALPAPVASALRTVVDGQTAAGSPSVVSQPSPQTTVVGGSATFSVSATGDAPLSYQWFHNDDDIAGATAATLNLSNVQAADLGSYYVVVSNAVGSTTSNAAALVILGLPPVISAPPVSQTVNAGVNVTFSVTVAGSPTLTYQWRKDGFPIATATTSTLNLANVQADAAGSYDVVVTNSVDAATSAAASLVVNPAVPSITTGPVNKTATTGGNASFTVVAAGTAPLTYQWRKAGSPLADGGVISGATTATLLLTGVGAVNGGSYDVVVTNALGFATSTAATLTVNPPPPNNVFWDFGPGPAPTASPSSGLGTDITGGAVTQGNNNGTTPLLTTTSVSTGTGASGAVNAGAATINGALNTAASTYFQFTLAPSAGKRLLATGFAFRTRSTATGPQGYSVFSSVDGFTAPVASGPLANNSNWTLVTTTFTTVTGLTDTPVTFRIYGHNGVGATGSTAVWRIDDLSLTINAVFPPPVAPVVTGTSPANGATSVPIATPITVTFNEAVSFTGSWFAINSAANGPTSATVTGGPTTYTLTPPSFFANTDTIHVTIFGAQVVDQVSGTIHGTSDTTFGFTTEVYVPPTPPTVVTQPVTQTVFAGANVSLSVSATGTAPLGYQWRKGGVAISGNGTAVTANLTLAGVGVADSGNYDCVVTNVAGSDVSHVAGLTVNLVPPSITTQPAAQMTAVGGNATFTVGASGTGPLFYQWRKGGVPLANGGVISGATTATLTLSGVTTVDNGAYDVIVSNPANSATSSAALLAVSDAAPGAIFWDFATANPTSGIPAGVTGGTVTQGNNNGTTALLTTTSASTPAATFSGGNNAGAAARVGALNQAAAGSAYFEFTFTPEPGRQFVATGISFGMRSTGTGPQAVALFTSLDGFTAPVAVSPVFADSVWRVITPAFGGVTGAIGAPVTFRLFGYNGSGGAGANTANWRLDDLRLTAGVLALPPVPAAIATPPVAQTVTVGDDATFSLVASGTAPFTYQWRKGGVAIASNVSATTDTLLLTDVTTADAGSYDCVVTNIAGTATSDPVALTVNQATATVTLAGLNHTFDGLPHAASATTAPTGLAVALTYDGSPVVPTNAGSYAVVATVNDADYTGSVSGTLVIAPAPASVTLSNLSQTYNGSPKVAAAITAPVGLSVGFTYNGSVTAPTNAGSYAVVAMVNDANYTGSASGTLVIAPAPATVTLSNLNQTFDGTPKAATATTVPAGLSVGLAYNGSPVAPTNAGSYAVTAVVSDPNYAGATSGTLVIAVGNATISLADLVQAYDGNPKPVTIVTNPADLPVTVTYNGGSTVPTLPGSYAVVATINDPNYTGTASNTLTITITALIRHAPVLNGGLDGSAQVLLPESITFNGSAWFSGDLLVRGTPVVNQNGHPVFGGTHDGTGSVAPSNYTVTLNNGAVLRYLLRRIDAITMPVVPVPPQPAGTRNVSLNGPGQSPGNFATLRNLTLNSGVGAITVPAGTYGSFTANSGSSFVLGVAGATEPAVYNLQALALNGSTTRLQIVGPVILNVASSISANGSLGNSAHPEWLQLNLASGGLTLNGSVTVDGYVVAPAGTITINSGCTLNGEVICDRLTLNGSGVLRSPDPE